MKKGHLALSLMMKTAEITKAFVDGVKIRIARFAFQVA